MPTIFDNIERPLIDALRKLLPQSQAAAFCVGYLNLRGWEQLADLVDAFPGGTEDAGCRVLVGMHRPPEEEMKTLASLKHDSDLVDGPTLARLKRRMTESFKQQLECGAPSAKAEHAFRRLAAQLRARKVFLKAFLRYPLHAKLYLVRRNDTVTPLIGFVGSSNLTLSGLAQQGELNVDVVEQDAARKLHAWFDDRWRDELAIDLTDTLAELIETSWARTELVRPYLVYLKVACHLSEEARQGERAFRLPRIFRQKGARLLDFQERAVSLAAHYLYRRGGVLLGDVVGLGKTLMATAIARVFQEDEQSNTLVICPPKLAPMWEQYRHTYEINGQVLSLGKAADVLGRDNAPRYRLLIIDESHNLRNRESKRYRAIRAYIERNEPRVLLLTATPYNKQFTDVSNQLRLFVDEDRVLPIRPERFFQDWAASGKTEADFIAQFQTSPRSLRAFELSPFPDDWRDLMRMFLVRRTRRFIINHYAQFDEQKQRYFVKLDDKPAYFPLRQPRRLEFPIHDQDPNDQYARLFSDDVVQIIEQLHLPRYGLAGYLIANANRHANEQEKRLLENLNRGGRRLIGVCRTNLFKRLESSGSSFLVSVERHILRNLVTLYALEQGRPIPIGAQDAALLDTAVRDSDAEFVDIDQNNALAASAAGAASAAPADSMAANPRPTSLAAYRQRAEQVYKTYCTQQISRFQWLDPKFFRPDLKQALEDDAKLLLHVLQQAGAWDPSHDAKLNELGNLLTQCHPRDKVLIFTQFADTAVYLGEQLQKRGLSNLAVVTADSPDPVALARRFSPKSNGGLRSDEKEIRILIATDVFAEGQNLQDCHIIVNYDLPWAIIRLIQRAGRVDRIGQKHDTITVYSFLPADGVERIIRLRKRLVQRLQENQEVIGADETFFGEEGEIRLRDLYTERAGTLDDDSSDEDIDLASWALQVWNSASEADRKTAVALPPISSATRALADIADSTPGVITYLRYPDGADALVRVDEHGNLVSQSLSAIFRAAACVPDTPPLPRAENHHELVARCVEIATAEQEALGGQLGSLRSVRRKLYERLKRYREQVQAKPTRFTRETVEQIGHVLDLIWQYPLKESARDAISRQMRLGITDEALLELVLHRAMDDNLCDVTEKEDNSHAEPHIVCSMGVVRATETMEG
ncbi:helicase-related protein [Roseiflexus castenholzii]|uniref:helicase-related protein n=1 Tax=Roseiflexus castenholzii TaxID=120962 RepID=UPI003C7A3203